MSKQDPKPVSTLVPDAPATVAAVTKPDVIHGTSVPVDEFHGEGGTFVIDPATGKRTRVEEPTDDSKPHFQKGA